MLSRVLEPEAMDTAEEAAEYDAINHGPVNAAFVHDCLAHAPVGPGELLVLDPGTGTARIPLELCARAPRARVLAVDLARHMLALAQRHLQSTDRVMLLRADAKRLPLGDSAIALVACNSLLHHMPEPRPLLRELWRVTAPGGTLFLRDLCRPADEEELARLVARHAAGDSQRQRGLFAASLRAGLTLEELRALAASAGLDPGAVRRTSDRHLTLVAHRA